MPYKNELHQLMIASVLALTTLLFFAASIALAGDPTVTIVAPSHEIGDLGAALGNTWTMDSTGDVTWRQPDASGRTVNYTAQSGVAGAYGTVLRGETPKGSDLVSAFYTNGGVDIPDETYRYLLYRSWIAPHQAGEGGQPRTNGRVLYSSGWGPNWLYQAFPFRRYSKPYHMCGYGQWCLYFFDLTQNINGRGSPHPWDWGDPAVIKAFGLWPHENWARADGSPSGDSPNYFYLDFLYLTGPIVTSPPPESRYLIRWNVSDTDEGPVTSKLYYQKKEELLLPSQSPTCDSSLNGWQAIPGGTSSITFPKQPYQVFLPLIFKGNTSSSPFGSGVVGPYNQSFNWDLSSPTYETGKVYYICTVVTDGQGNEGYGVSSAPVIKVPALTPLSEG